MLITKEMHMALGLDILLGKIRDPRQRGKVSHPLPALFKLVMLGKLCGRMTLKSSWRMGKRLPSSSLKRLGFRDGIAPCYTTLTELFKAVDADEVRLVLATSVRGLTLPEAEVIAVDGKTLCGSGDDTTVPVKLLAAFSARLQGIIGEVPVPQGNNEITALLDLLDKVDVAGMIVTGDAIFAQREICSKVVQKKADFVFTVKDNQKALRQRIQAATGTADAALSPSGCSKHN
jgi:DDE_Tnp_1-associated/Transposase DDE domain